MISRRALLEHATTIICAGAGGRASSSVASSSSGAVGAGSVGDGCSGKAASRHVSMHADATAGGGKSSGDGGGAADGAPLSRMASQVSNVEGVVRSTNVTGHIRFPCNSRQQGVGMPLR